MAYSYETSSVKTIDGEVSGLADVVARQAIANLPTLSAGEGIALVTEDGKTRIENNISAGTNISLVWDEETNKIRIDCEAEGGGIDWTTGTNISAIIQTSNGEPNGDFQIKLGKFPTYDGMGKGLEISALDGGTNYNDIVIDPQSIYAKSVFNYGITQTNTLKISPRFPDSIISYSSVQNGYNNSFDINTNHFSNNYTGSNISRKFELNQYGLSYDYTGSNATSSVRWTWDDIQYIQNNSANLGKTYSGIAPIVVNNTTNQISADTWSFSAGYGLVFTDDNVNKVTKLEVEGESLSAGPNIDIFSSGGYVVISATGGAAFPMTGTDGTTNYTANANFSSFTLTTGQGAAGAHVNMNVKGVHYEAYPSTDVSASWYNIINTTNNSSNCYCIRFKDGFTAADLANYSAYDKVTVVHSNEYTQDCHLYWDGNTKVFPSGLYCELVKGTNDQNQIDWFFTNSGWINNLWWDWD